MKEVTNLKLGIGFPCSWAHVPFSFFMSFVQLERPTFIPLAATNGPIDGLRNHIVEQAFQAGCSHLIMMDLDQIYPVETITKLLSHRLPVVGCLIHRRYPPFDPLIVRGEINRYETINDWNDGDLVEVDATGTGCLMFDMRIFETLKPPWFRFRPNPDPSKGGVVGEDFGLCSDLKAAGYKIFVDTSIKCGHLSNMVVTEELWRLYKKLDEVRLKQNNMKE